MLTSTELITLVRQANDLGLLPSPDYEIRIYQNRDGFIHSEHCPKGATTDIDTLTLPQAFGLTHIWCRDCMSDMIAGDKSHALRGQQIGHVIKELLNVREVIRSHKNAETFKQKIELVQAMSFLETLWGYHLGYESYSYSNSAEDLFPKSSFRSLGLAMGSEDSECRIVDLSLNIAKKHHKELTEFLTNAYQGIYDGSLFAKGETHDEGTVFFSYDAANDRPSSFYWDPAKTFTAETHDMKYLKKSADEVTRRYLSISLMQANKITFGGFDLCFLPLKVADQFSEIGYAKGEIEDLFLPQAFDKTQMHTLISLAEMSRRINEDVWNELDHVEKAYPSFKALN